jgi:hypothetical protein
MGVTPLSVLRMLPFGWWASLLLPSAGYGHSQVSSFHTAHLLALQVHSVKLVIHICPFYHIVCDISMCPLQLVINDCMLCFLVFPSRFTSLHTAPSFLLHLSMTQHSCGSFLPASLGTDWEFLHHLTSPCLPVIQVQHLWHTP